jgi:uncharacterized membrane protein HdeD (DUF308 family)
VQGDLTNPWDYLDFELENRAGGPREYPVSVRSPAGEAQGELRFPFDEWELRDRLKSLEIALLRSGGTRRRIASPEEHAVQAFGRGLFESLLVGEVRTRYEMSLSEARRQGKGLRLKLRIQPSELAVLPWEYLYDAENDRYPSLSSNTPLVRYLDLPRPVAPLRVSPPLRVLGMVTSPSGLNPLDVEHEKRLVEEATRGLRESNLLELTWLEGQTWRHLMRAMRRGPWHVFHFIGHGGFDAATEEGALALSDEAGHMHLLRARGLAELLDDHYPLRLVFLNSCEGARGSENDAFSSTAATLVRRGVPAVVAMQYEITDRAAIEFSRDFYEALADNLPVDAAVTEARTAVSIDSLLEWGTPVLYTHSPDGRVFDVSSSPTYEIPSGRSSERKYREGVRSAWASGRLGPDDTRWLKQLAYDELGLNPDTAAAIEREVMGGTIEEILEDQEAADEEERAGRLDSLYAEARRWHRDRRWEQVIALFEQINAEDPDYPDPEGLGVSARDALAAQERKQVVAALYDRGQRYINSREWRRAIESFEEIQRLEPNYRATNALLTKARRQESAARAATAEQVAGQTGERAGRTRPERPADTRDHPSATLDRNWWALGVAGLLIMLLGLGDILILPNEPGPGYALITSSGLVATGAFAFIASRTAPPGLLLRAQGVISGLAGVVAFISAASNLNYVPSSFDDALQNEPLLLVHFAAFELWGICVGIIQIIVATRLRSDSSLTWLVAASGASLTAYGLMGIYFVYRWTNAFSWLLGIGLLVSGISLAILALGVRQRTQV